MIIVKTRSCIAVAILAAGIGFAQQRSTSAPKPVGVPSEEEIQSFKTTHAVSDTETITMTATFTVPPQTPDMLKRYAKNGKVPYRVTLELMRANAKTKSSERVLGKNGVLAILDENGALVKRAQESLGNLCPS